MESPPQHGVPLKLAGSCLLLFRIETHSPESFVWLLLCLVLAVLTSEGGRLYGTKHIQKRLYSLFSRRTARSPSSLEDELLGATKCGDTYLWVEQEPRWIYGSGFHDPVVKPLQSCSSRY